MVAETGRDVAVDVDAFVADGFVAVRGAIDRDLALACRAALEPQLPRADPPPVVRLLPAFTAEFDAAGRSPRLLAAYAVLIGDAPWTAPRFIGGTVPVRFPSEVDPGDAGWHVDGSYQRDGTYWANVRSRDRALLGLVLLSDVGPDDAPTRILVGSHLDVPAVLAPHGDDGADFLTIAAALPASTFDRPVAHATGRAGDVFVCHPFLVHAASWPHRGEGPRFVAQPSVPLLEPFGLDPARPSGPVEQAILAGLRG